MNAHFSLFTLASYLIGGRPQSGWPSEPNAVGNGRIIPICGGHHRARAIVLVAPVCRPITSEIPDDDEPIQTCISSRLYVHTHTLMMFVLISSYFFFFILWSGGSFAFDWIFWKWLFLWSTLWFSFFFIHFFPLFWSVRMITRSVAAKGRPCRRGILCYT